MHRMTSDFSGWDDARSMRLLSLCVFLTRLSQSESGLGGGGKGTSQRSRFFKLPSMSIRNRMSLVTTYCQSRANNGGKKTDHSHFNQCWSNSSLMVNTFVFPGTSFGRRGLGSPQYSLLYTPQMASLQLVTMLTIRSRCNGASEGIKCGGALFCGNHVTGDPASFLTVVCLRQRKGSGSSDCCEGNEDGEAGPTILSVGRARKLGNVTDR